MREGDHKARVSASAIVFIGTAVVAVVSVLAGSSPLWLAAGSLFACGVLLRKRSGQPLLPTELLENPLVTGVLIGAGAVALGIGWLLLAAGPDKILIGTCFCLGGAVFLGTTIRGELRKRR